MTHDPKHGPSIHASVKPDGSHDQHTVANNAQAAVEAMRAGKLHVTPLAESEGVLSGKKGVFRTFFSTGEV